jgi:predicted ATPase
MPDVFKSIKDDFVNEAFKQVEDIRFEVSGKILGDDNSIIDDAYSLEIKEKDTGWISQDRISAGMFKTLINIAGIKLFPKGCIILIDEFENSLGTNCIDVVAERLAEGNEDMQFIITSHHPYIINRIHMDNWKIVTRTGSTVSTKDAKDFNLGKSKHEAFQQLINLDEFVNGIK